MLRKLTFLILILIPFFAFPQNKSYTTKRINPAPPEIDGKFDDECWQHVAWEGNFV